MRVFALLFLMPLVLALAHPSAAHAECLGQGCYDGVGALVLVALLYIFTFIVLIVLLVRGKIRAVRNISIGIVLLWFGVPALSYALALSGHKSVSRQEVLGQPPLMADRVPLLISDPRLCELGPCAQVMYNSENRRVLALSRAAVKDLDLSGRIDLATLPLEYWTGGRPTQTPLTAEERAEIGPRIDYLIFAGDRYGWRRDRSLAVGGVEPIFEPEAEHKLRIGMVSLSEPGVFEQSKFTYDLKELGSGQSYALLPLFPDNYSHIETEMPEEFALPFRLSVCPPNDAYCRQSQAWHFY